MVNYTHLDLDYHTETIINNKNHQEPFGTGYPKHSLNKMIWKFLKQMKARSCENDSYLLMVIK